MNAKVSTKVVASPIIATVTKTIPLKLSEPLDHLKDNCFRKSGLSSVEYSAKKNVKIRVATVPVTKPEVKPRP